MDGEHEVSKPLTGDAGFVLARWEAKKTKSYNARRSSPGFEAMRLMVEGHFFPMQQHRGSLRAVLLKA